MTTDLPDRLPPCCEETAATFESELEATQVDRDRYRDALERIAAIVDPQRESGGRLPEAALQMQEVAREALDG